MIDFRYHLVSLISVFMALAVGVVLGAGPLQNSLGTALNDQVTQLREDRNATQARLEDTEKAVNERDSYIEGLADQVLPGTLTGLDVALVVLPQADGGDVDALTARLEAAGATVVVRADLTDKWTDLSEETYRSTFAGQLSAHLGGTTTGTGNEVLGAGLATALTTQDEHATALRGLLTATSTPLVRLSAEPTGPARAVVVLGPREASEPGPTAGATPVSDPTAWAPTVSGIASTVDTVVVGAAGSDTDLVSVVRAAKVQVSTVDSVGQSTALVSTVLALKAAGAGTVGAYGLDHGATSVLPGSVLATAQPTQG